MTYEITMKKTMLMGLIVAAIAATTLTVASNERVRWDTKGVSRTTICFINGKRPLTRSSNRTNGGILILFM